MSMKRAIIFNLAFLAATLVVASSLIETRHTVSLAEPVSPDGWNIAFSPPAGWDPVVHQKNIFSDFLVFDLVSEKTPLRRLHVRRIGILPTADPGDVALECLQSFGVATHSNSSRKLNSYPIEFGDTEGVVIETEREVISVAGVVGGSGYCFVIESSQIPIREYDRAVILAITESIVRIR